MFGINLWFNHGMETRSIYFWVGKKIKGAQARIVGRIAEIKTQHGVVEIDKWYPSFDDAFAKTNLRGKRK